jgi:Flp pilus assembly pilin Flp
MRAHPHLYRLGGDTRGAGLVEYLILVGLIAVVALAGARRLGTSVDSRVTAQAACVESLACAGSGSGSAIQAGSEDAPLLGAGQIRAGATAIGTADIATSKPFLQRLWDGVRGFFVDGVWGTVTGIWDIVTHPIQTIQGLWHAVTHPVSTFLAIRDAISNAWNDNPDRFVGAVIFEVVTLPVTALKAARAGRIATATRVTRAVDAGDDAGDAARAARAAEESGDAARAANAADEAEDAAAARRASDEARTASLPGTVVRADPGTVEGRRALALETLMNGPPAMTQERALSHMRGIDFTRPVEIVRVGPGDELVQFNLPGQRGKYFAPRGTSAESLGIDPAGRVVETYRAPDEGILALRSTAAEIESFTDRNGNVIRGGAGGGVQYKVADSDGFRRVP